MDIELGSIGVLCNQLIYPNEKITNGLKIEYTSIDEPFVNQDPESTLIVVLRKTLLKVQLLTLMQIEC